MRKLMMFLVLVMFISFTINPAHAALINIGHATFDGNNFHRLIWDDDNNSNSVVWLDYTNAPMNWSDLRIEENWGHC